MSLKLVRRKGTRHYYLRGTVKGQAVWETTGTDDRALADAIRIKREHGILQRAVFGASATVSFLEAAVSYLDNGGEARFLGKCDDETGRWSGLIGRFAEARLIDIDQAAADAAALALFPNAGAATRKRMVYVPLCAVLNHAARKGWCSRPMIGHPKIAPSRTKWSTPERLKRLVNHCKPRERRLVVFLTYTGARLSEALRVDWDKDIRLSERTVILRRTKNGEMRAVHVPDPLLVELAAVPEANRSGPLFDYTDKTRVYAPLRRACAKAGVEYLPPHQQGRHTYATWLRTYGGLDLVGLKEAGGWKSIASVARYAHVTPNEAARAADKMPDVQKPLAPAA